ncbi:hypothetical protein C8R43DRAFT_1118472 [Mycena crocata]|nr:hypothetical protein C8R43DRAFT_1118472 [Mycena crocata]
MRMESLSEPETHLRSLLAPVLHAAFASTSSPVLTGYTVNFASAQSEVVLAATNTVASAAGLLVAMKLNIVPTGRTNCTAGVFLLSDPGWKSTKGAIPAGFEQPGFDDSAWPDVVAQAGYPATPWGTITIAAPSPPVTVQHHQFKTWA